MIKNFFVIKDKTSLKKNTILWKAIKFYVSAQIIVLIFLICLFSFLKILGIDPTIFKEKELDDSFYNSSVSIALIAPILEELAFRLGLSFNKKHILISFPLLVFFLLKIFLGKTSEMLFLFIAVSFFSLVVIYFSKTTFWENYKIKWGKQAIISTTFLFAFCHIANFSIEINYLPIYFLLCLPQVVMGITFTYLRLNHSFLSAVIMHIAINSFSVLVL